MLKFHQYFTIITGLAKSAHTLPKSGVALRTKMAGLTQRLYESVSSQAQRLEGFLQSKNKMPSRQQFREAVFANAAEVRKQEPGLLLARGPGTYYVLARHCKVADVFEDEDAALAEGQLRYKDGLFSVHEICARPTFGGGSHTNR
jgi:hypothetical protein